jgi:hypothetical protein
MLPRSPAQFNLLKPHRPGSLRKPIIIGIITIVIIIDIVTIVVITTIVTTIHTITVLIDIASVCAGGSETTFARASHLVLRVGVRGLTRGRNTSKKPFVD